MQTLMFATGIECSYPMINGKRIDELELTKHYDRWQEDLSLTRELGVRYLRYGIPYHRVSTAAGKYDWSFCDEVLPYMRKLEIEPIIDLCHFGMPDWLGNSFQNPEFPYAFADYARAFALRYPYIKLYTPINEIFICARFSAQYGWWNEQEKGDKPFVMATCNLVKASMLAMEKILAVQPQAVFFQSESSEHTHTICGHPATEKLVDWENQIRFLALDLLYSHEVQSDVLTWLLNNGLSMDEYRWYINNRTHTRCVLGNDYYSTNERIYDHEGKIAYMGEVWGWYLVTKEYYDRYRKPIMHTETNGREMAESVGWLWRQWQHLLRMRVEGVPILGFTWYSLIDQFDWDSELREAKGNVNAVGLYDLDRKIRPVGTAYKNLIEEFSWLPIVPNGDFLGLV